MSPDLYISEVLSKVEEMLKNKSYEDPKSTRDLLIDIKESFYHALKVGVDFKVVVDSLDDSIFVTDAKGKCLYVNPAYEKNTSIKADEVLGRTVADIVAEGNLFTGGATLDVLKTKQKSFRLANVTKTNPPSLGYTLGVPIFDENGEIKQVVVNSRPLNSFKELRDDFGKFVDQMNEDLANKSPSSITHTSEGMSSKLVGSSEGLQKVWKTLQMAAPTDATVLITGESGVGKEIVADEIYRLSLRKDKPFIKVNCASIPVNLLESELFGYEKGAFSGASVNGKQGLFEMANGGTLLLDEIDDMPMDLQVKLLRAIQNKEITRVGGTKPISLDIRFIASTNSELSTKIKTGEFRQDLYYRLNVIPIHIPPLRERKSDVDSLCDYFVTMYTKKHNRHFALSDENRELLRSYNWPGNIRELENVIEYLTICASGSSHVAGELIKNIIDFTDSDKLEAENTSENSTALHTVEYDYQSTTLSDSVQQFEKRVIEDALSRTGSLREAGNILGVNASTLSRKIKQYGIDYVHSKN